MSDHNHTPGEIPHPMDQVLKTSLAKLTNGISPTAMSAALEAWWSHLRVSPGKQAELLTSAMQKQQQWLMHMQPGSNGIEALERDKRFSAPQWQQPPFKGMAQAFVLADEWWREATSGVRGVSAHHESVVQFIARQWLDMASPSNFVATNPQVLQATVATGGQNLWRGFGNWWHDAVAVKAHARPAGAERFEPGQTVALTPGKVVMRNRLIELIQYAPTTATVHPEPVLIVPSWIMKYYILDLSPENSLIKYLVDHGHTVYAISWKNPDAGDRHLGMADYLELGVLDAVRAVQQLSPGVGIHATGYCLGGTLLGIAAATLAREPKSPLKTLSVLAGQMDFQQPGELALFIDEAQIAFLEDLMSEHGYLDGRQMAGAFALINSKDLVWSKLVHEYLMGSQTALNDLRAWNADATRMPERMHSEYLRGFYLNNDLAEGRYLVHGKPIALRDVHLPAFVVGTEKDHVSPWQSVYKIHLLTDTEITFALTSGGHNVGVVNPPEGPAANAAASHRLGVRPAGGAYHDPEDWLASATPHAGSWWPTWQAWLAAHSGKPVKPRPIRGHESVNGEPLIDAPGCYVHGS